MKKTPKTKPVDLIKLRPKKKEPTIEFIGIIGKFSDGTYRQIFFKQSLQPSILHIIASAEIPYQVKVSEDILEGVSLTR